MVAASASCLSSERRSARASASRSPAPPTWAVMSLVWSVRDTTWAPCSRDRSVSVAARLALGTLSWKSAPALALPAPEVTLELLTNPFSAPTTLKTCWATSLIRSGAADSWS